MRLIAPKAHPTITRSTIVVSSSVLERKNKRRNSEFF
jgi:hypothetical protein